ncbi:MAG: FAD-dependent oxidoreductase [Candidatus Obscuribacterales bacterium]|nr:FAD-dependent oxidoreductase [Steroidobacteraceae bacterium]
MKIAVIGAGIAGNVAAYHLARDHQVTVFEAGSYVGGHTHTHAVEQHGRHYNIDTGFIVFNDWTYPNFIRLLDELDVRSQVSQMSFSVRDETSGLEYNGTTLNTLFAQRRNLLRPKFWLMIRDILRFSREAPAVLDESSDDTTLGEYLFTNNYSREFIEHYIIPMGAAIWSTDAQNMRRFPARYFVRFFHNHGMLSVDARPQWRVIEGGSACYVEKLTASFRERIRLNTPVDTIRRLPGCVLIKTAGNEAETFDAAFLACHSDEALKLLADPSPQELEVLSAIPYQHNEAVLHTDTRLMPRRRLAWAAWNYHVLPQPEERVALTYNMNILQGIDASAPFFVTLNNTAAINPTKIIKRLSYSHPLYTLRGVAAQARQEEINGPLNTYYCGAYWRNGFHEDGVVSALAALEHFNERHDYAQRALFRTA